MPPRPLVPVVAAVFAALASGAEAHTGDEPRRPVIVAVEPPVRGLDVGVVPGEPGKLRLLTRGRIRATVLGGRGQPILRSGPGGVQANAAAPEWHTFNEPAGVAVVPPEASASAPPRWTRVSRLRSWEWFDHRLHPAGGPVTGFEVPLRVGGRRVRVRGRLVAGTLALEPRLDPGVVVPGAEIAVGRAATPTLLLRRTGDEMLEIDGADGEVFARIGDTGVQANVRSPVWVPAGQFRNRSFLTAVIDPAAPPRWVDASPAQELVWPDPRLLPRGRPDGPPGSVVARWSIPVRSGERAVLVTGTTVLGGGSAAQGAARPAPPRGLVAGEGDREALGPGTFLAGGAVVLIALAGGALALRRRGSSARRRP